MEKKRTTAYLCGPMTGIKDYNFPAFDAAQADLEKQGYKVISPAQMDRDSGFDPTKDRFEGETKEAVIKRDCEAVMRADVIFVLPNWEDSIGSNAEIPLARWRGIPIYYFPGGMPFNWEVYDSWKETITMPPATGKLIAFCGAKQSGKTTLATLLVNNQGYERMSFAQPMRDMIAAMGVDSQYLNVLKTTPIPNLPGNPTARHLMQTLGTEWGRDCVHKDLWVTLASRKFTEARERGVNVVIDDLRFPNEADIIGDLGGLVIQITRPGLKLEDGHESEMYWKEIPYNFGIDNKTSPEEMLEDFNMWMADPDIQDRMEYPHGKL